MKFQPSWKKLNKNSPSVQVENDYIIIIILLNTENKTSILSLSPISCPGLSDACSALHSIAGTESTLHQQDLDVFSHSRSPGGDLQISTVTCIIELLCTIMYYWNMYYCRDFNSFFFQIAFVIYSYILNAISFAIDLCSQLQFIVYQYCNSCLATLYT